MLRNTQTTGLLRRITYTLVQVPVTQPLLTADELSLKLGETLQVELQRNRYTSFLQLLRSHPKLFAIEGENRVRTRVPASVLFDLHDAIKEAARFGWSGTTMSPGIGEICGFLHPATTEFLHRERIISFRMFLEEYMFPWVVLVMGSTRCRWIESERTIAKIRAAPEGTIVEHREVSVSKHNTSNLVGASLRDATDASSFWDSNPQFWTEAQKQGVLDAGNVLWEHLPSDGTSRDVIDVMHESRLNLRHDRYAQLGRKLYVFPHPKIGCSAAPGKRFKIWRR